MRGSVYELKPKRNLLTSPFQTFFFFSIFNPFFFLQLSMGVLAFCVTKLLAPIPGKRPWFKKECQVRCIHFLQLPTIFSRKSMLFLLYSRSFQPLLDSRIVSTLLLLFFFLLLFITATSLFQVSKSLLVSYCYCNNIS